MYGLLPVSQIVAAIQFDPKLLAVDENLATALQLTFEAAAKGAKVIVLPELAFSGFSLDNVSEAMQCAQTRDGFQTEAFVSIAQRFGCHIVFGYVELYEGKLYNSAAIVGPLGLEGNTQKHNLWGRDNLWAQPSECANPIVMTGAGRLGVLLCRDATNNYRESYAFHNPKSKFYRRGDVDTIALVTNWGSGYSYPDSAWVELVESTRANLIVSNRVGKERDMLFKGGSAVIDRDRRIYTFGSSFTEEAVVGGIVLL
jgi:N-carbamoylputrescine amidase